MADLADYAKTLARDLKNVTEATTISSDFLSRLLLDSHYQHTPWYRGVRLRHARFAGPIDLANITIAEPLWLEDCVFDGQVNLTEVVAKKSILLNNSVFHGRLVLYGARIDGTLEINGVTAGEMLAASLTVGQQLNIVDSRVDKLNLFSLQAGDHVFLNRSVIRDADLDSSRLNRNLIIRGTTLATLRLDDARIAGTLVLGTQRSDAFGGGGDPLTDRDWKRRYTHEQRMVWLPMGSIDARGAHVGQLDTDVASWPGERHLTGFAYDAIGGSAIGDLGAEPVKSLAAFADADYSPQAYEQLASALEKDGRKDKAKEIRYAQGAAELRRAHGLSWWWLAINQVMIGYGQRPERSLAWALGLILVGACIAHGGAPTIRSGLTYSCDMLIPALKLSPEYEDMKLPGWRRYYFYGHKLMGYVLTLFIIGAITGLLK